MLKKKKREATQVTRNHKTHWDSKIVGNFEERQKPLSVDFEL